MSEAVAHFDYVIVGGGSAGCVLASRLSEDPTVRVCLLEAGGDNVSPIVSTPGFFAYFMFSKKYNWFYLDKPNPALRHGQPVFLPRGKGLGGSSAINAMVYIRGHRADYDEWAALGNAGWSYDEVLPYFRRSECNTRGANVFHGSDGPLHVSDSDLHYPISKVFLEAAKQAGLPLTDDFNGEQQEGIGAYQFTIRDGKRPSVAGGYLRPVLSRPNLTVITGAHVLRIEIEDKRATGVTYALDGKHCLAKASQEVLLSAGAYNSPQILMLSGIGDPATLQPHGIHVRHALPGVGQNLREHPDSCVLTSSRVHGGISLAPRDVLRVVWNFFRYIFTGKGTMRASPTEVGGFLRTSPEQAVPDVQFHTLPVLFDDSGRDLKLLAGTGYSCHVCVLRPKSVGHLGLNSADPYAPPAIDNRMLTHPADVKTLVAGIRLARQWLAAPAFDRYRKMELSPGIAKQSDEEIADAARASIGTAYHPVGTCKMGSDAMAVVDSRLRVHGIQGLRVVDASIMPTLIGGNTNAPTIMIAEKAADMIRADRAAQHAINPFTNAASPAPTH